MQLMVLQQAGRQGPVDLVLVRALTDKNKFLPPVAPFFMPAPFNFFLVFPECRVPVPFGMKACCTTKRRRFLYGASRRPGEKLMAVSGRDASQNKPLARIRQAG